LNNLGKNIKHLRKQEKYSQNELAQSLGVSQTSIAHYEAGTRQPTIETLMELSQLFNQPIDSLVGNSIQGKKSGTQEIAHKELVNLLVELLLNKDESEFMTVFNRSVYPFYDINDMADKLIKEVMYTIGNLWEQGNITEADEHYATNIIRKVISYLSVIDDEKMKNRKAISFTVGSEKHTLGLEMVNACLKSEGIESIYLGNDLPVRSLEKVIKDLNPNYLFISITMKDSMNSLVHLVNYINEKYKSDIVIGVGGQGLVEDTNLTKHNNLYVLKNIDELMELVNR